MAPPDNNKDDPLYQAPGDLRRTVEKSVRPDDVVAVAPHDLDEHGLYAEGWLVLTERKLGHFTRRDGRWTPEWFEISALDKALLVEGLGMNALRLVRDGRKAAEFRTTLRNAKAVARVQRLLERLVSGDGDIQALAEEPTHGDEKKLRCEKCGRVIPPWSDVCPACTSRRKVLFRLLDFIKPYKYRALLAFALALALTGMGVAMPWLTRPLVNEGLGAGPGFEPSYRIVLIIVGLMADLMLLRTVLQIAQLKLSLGLGTLVSRQIRNVIYAHLHRLSVGFFSKRQTGELVSRVTHDTERIWYFVSSTFIDMVLAFLTIATIGGCLMVMNWKLALFTLLPIPLMLFLMVFFHKRLHRFFGRMWQQWARLTSVVAGALPGVRVIKAFSQEDREVGRFREQSQSLYNIEVDYITSVRSVFHPAMFLASSIAALIVWLLGGWWVYKGETDLGTLVAFQQFLGMFFMPIRQIAHMDEMLNRAATSAHRVFEILDTDPAIYSKSGSRSGENIEGRIELRNVSFTYDGVRKVLKNVNATIEAGEMLGLAGPSGGGKTTLVNLICRFYDPLEGSILVDGVDVRDYDLSTLRRKIGVVLQEPFLFHGTVAENIAYGRPEATLDEVIEAARAANAHDFIVGFPDAYDTLVGERGQTLSGGERQRISIARAILNDPAVLILDEATSSVDTGTEKLIQDALEHLTRHRTTIAIAHRLSTLRKANRLLILEKGKVIEEGTHEELAAKEGGLYAKLLTMQRESQSVIGLAGKLPIGSRAESPGRFRRH